MEKENEELTQITESLASLQIAERNLPLQIKKAESEQNTLNRRQDGLIKSK